MPLSSTPAGHLLGHQEMEGKVGATAPSASVSSTSVRRRRLCIVNPLTSRSSRLCLPTHIYAGPSKMRALPHESINGVGVVMGRSRRMDAFFSLQPGGARSFAAHLMGRPSPSLAEASARPQNTTHALKRLEAAAAGHGRWPISYRRGAGARTCKRSVGPNMHALIDAQTPRKENEEPLPNKVHNEEGKQRHVARSTQHKEAAQSNAEILAWPAVPITTVCPFQQRMERSTSRAATAGRCDP